MNELYFPYHSSRVGESTTQLMNIRKPRRLYYSKQSNQPTKFIAVISVDLLYRQRHFGAANEEN